MCLVRTDFVYNRRWAIRIQSLWLQWKSLGTLNWSPWKAFGRQILSLLHIVSNGSFWGAKSFSTLQTFVVEMFITEISINSYRLMNDATVLALFKSRWFPIDVAVANSHLSWWRNFSFDFWHLRTDVIYDCAFWSQIHTFGECCLMMEQIRSDFGLGDQHFNRDRPREFLESCDASHGHLVLLTNKFKLNEQKPMINFTWYLCSCLQIP
jgi:hypothetical protein